MNVFVLFQPIIPKDLQTVPSSSQEPRLVFVILYLHKRYILALTIFAQADINH